MMISFGRNCLAGRGRKLKMGNLKELGVLDSFFRCAKILPLKGSKKIFTFWIDLNGFVAKFS